MPNQTKAIITKEGLEKTIGYKDKQIKDLLNQMQRVGEDLARVTILVQTQDGEIGRLTALNDRMFKIIDKLITKE